MAQIKYLRIRITRVEIQITKYVILEKQLSVVPHENMLW